MDRKEAAKVRVGDRLEYRGETYAVRRIETVYPKTSAERYYFDLGTAGMILYSRCHSEASLRRREDRLDDEMDALYESTEAIDDAESPSDEGTHTEYWLCLACKYVLILDVAGESSAQTCNCGRPMRRAYTRTEDLPH